MFGNTSAMTTTTMSLSVIDPCNRTGKITIPMEYVVETRGVLDHLRYAAMPQCVAPPAVKDLSLCLLFQKGRCNAGARCNQVHAAPEYVDHLRAVAASTKSCCARHGDVHSTSFIAESTVNLVNENGSETTYALVDFARTAALDNILRRSKQHGSVARVQSSRICRLSQRSSCKFGKDCKNIHLCRDATPVSAPPPLTAWSSRSSSHSAEEASIYAPSSTDSSFTTALGITGRCVAPSCHATLALEESTTMKTLDVSALTASDAFQSMRYDPLELPALDEESATCASSVNDFEAFVDALVDCGTSPMASPQWVVAP